MSRARLESRLIELEESTATRNAMITGYIESWEYDSFEEFQEAFEAKKAEGQNLIIISELGRDREQGPNHNKLFIRPWKDGVKHYEGSPEWKRFYEEKS